MIQNKLQPPTAEEIQHWPLDDQCLYLGIRKPHKIDIPTPAYPEHWILSIYQADGWVGLYSEWRFIMTFFKLLCEPKLENHRLYTHNFIYPSNAAGYWSNADTHLIRICDSMTNFERSSTGDLLDRFFYSQLPDEYGRIGYEQARGWMPSLFLEFYHSMGKNLLRQILEKLLEHGETRRFGWPDLMLMKNGQVRFVEVKRPKENLTLRQVELWRDVILPLGLNASIVVLGPTEKKSIVQTSFDLFLADIQAGSSQIRRETYATRCTDSDGTDIYITLGWTGKRWIIVTIDQLGQCRQLSDTTDHSYLDEAARELFDLTLSGSIVYQGRS